MPPQRYDARLIIKRDMLGLTYSFPFTDIHEQTDRVSSSRISRVWHNLLHTSHLDSVHQYDAQSWPGFVGSVAGEICAKCACHDKVPGKL